jgi:chaperone modulatory protein CbpM
MSLILNTSRVQQITDEGASGTTTTTSLTTIIATTISSAEPLSANDLAHACGADLAWVNELVALGIAGQSDPEQARLGQFGSADLQCALEASRLQRDFDVSLDAAALILDLQHEVRRLKASLRALGLS